MNHSRLGFALVAAAACALYGSPARAQETGAYITLYEPIEWATDGGIVNIRAGALVRLRGLAYHPAGVKEITAGGTAATLDSDPSGAVRFTGYVRAASGMSDIEITLTPETGDPFRKTYYLEVEGTEPAQETPPSGPSTTTSGGMSTGGALIGGLVVPGLGQMITKRPALGLAFMGGAIGAVVGSRVLSSPGKLECNEFDECMEIEARKNLVPAGIGVAAVLGIIGAIEARSYAARYNAELGSGGDGSSPGLRIDPGLERGSGDGSVGVRLLRLNF
jgi:hypothetical protein